MKPKHERKPELEKRLKALFLREAFGMKPGLKASEAVLAELGDPQHGYGVIHIAGTNGKGSVSAMIASMMGQLGLTVGLYTSPHLVDFSERIQIDGVPVGDPELEAALDAVQEAETACGWELTFFECATAMAWLIFRDRGVSVAVVETGMGGRLDATNVVMPLVSVVTRVGMDHSQWLGETLEAVAREKAGIIKPHRPVVSGPQEPEVAAILTAVAAERGSAWLQASEHVGIRLCSVGVEGQEIAISTADAEYGRARLPLLGEWQLENASIAIAAVETVCEMLGVVLEPAHVRGGLARVRWPGRLERVGENPAIYFDAAHNPLGAQALVHALHRLGIRDVTWIAGMCGDKDVQGVLRELRHLDGSLLAVPVEHGRGMDPERFAVVARGLGHRVRVFGSVGEALTRAIAETDTADTNHAIVVCGSIFLLGAAYRWLGREPFATPRE